MKDAAIKATARVMTSTVHTDILLLPLEELGYDESGIFGSADSDERFFYMIEKFFAYYKKNCYARGDEAVSFVPPSSLKKQGKKLYH